MQNHNVKIKNSAYRSIRPESVENPGVPGEQNLKKQSQFHWDSNERKVNYNKEL
jgi:hypothetical protein